MKKRSRRILSLLLCLAVAISMDMGAALSVFAGDETEGNVPDKKIAASEEFANEDLAADALESVSSTAKNAALPSGSTISPVNVNSGVSGAVYETGVVTTYADFTYNIAMPGPGTLRVYYSSSDAAASNYVSAKVAGTNLSSTGCDAVVNGVTVKGKMFTSNSASPVQLLVSVGRPSTMSSNKVAFSVEYFPLAAVTLTAPAGKYLYYYHGGTSSLTTASTFNIKVTQKGYLNLNMGDLSGIGYSLYIKAPGFAAGNGEYISRNDAERNIGVKPGVYTITVKSSAPAYGIRYRLYPVSESKFGKSKKKAVSVKKKKTKKGVIVTNGKKAHWYKFKNTKKKTVKLVIKTKINGGGNYGGIKVSMYDSKGRKTERTITTSGTTTITLFNTFNNKLKKGTYKVKIASYKNGNGYFTFKWK